MAKKIVEYDEWCKSCKYRFKEGVKDPCDECLEIPVNDDSKKPINYKPSKGGKS